MGGKGGGIENDPKKIGHHLWTFSLFSCTRMQKRYGPSTNTSRIVHQVVASCHKCNEKTLVPVVHSSSAA